MAAEDFTTYTEVDVPGRITITDADTLTLTAIQRDEDTYLYKDMGAGAIDDFVATVEFTADATPDTGGLIVFFGVSNSVDDTNNWAAGLFCYLYYDGSVYTLRVDEKGNPSKGITISAGTKYYITIVRYGVVFGMTVYSDAARTTIVGQHAVSCAATTYRYLYAVSSYNTASNLAASGLIEKLDMSEVIGTAGAIQALVIGDDGWEQIATSGILQDYSNIVRFGYWSGYGLCSTHLRRIVAIPAGAIIIGAFITLTRTVSRGWTTGVTLYSIEEDDVAMPTVGTWSTRWDARDKSEASVSWTFPAGAAGASSETPDIGTLVQEIIDRVGWSSGNNLGIFIKTPSGSGDTTQYIATDGHATPAYHPTLHIVYVAPPVGGGSAVPVFAHHLRSLRG